MNKKILSLVLALVMVLGTFGSVFAAEAKAEVKEKVKEVPKLTSTDAKVQWLKDVGIVEGRKVNEDEKNNDLALDKTIQRAEVTKLLVYAIGKQDLADQLKGAVRPFKDVEAGYWANGFITVGSTSPSPANGLPFLNGYPSGKFEGKWNVSYAELAKMLVVLSKKDLTKDLLNKANADWPSQWMRYAADMGILEGVSISNSNDNATRKDAFAMIYNALFVMKEWRIYPSNETIGVISDYKFKEYIKLNGEDKEYKVDEKTLYAGIMKNAPVRERTDFRPLQTVAEETWFVKNYFIGSLVRVVSDEKGVISHIVQLGNPKDLALNTIGWNGVAKVAESGKVNFNEKVKDGFVLRPMVANDDDMFKAYYGVAKADYNKTDRDTKIKYLNDRVASIKTMVKEAKNIQTTGDTKYFIADSFKGSVKKVNSLMEAYGYLQWMTNVAYDVYVGYDVTPIAKTNLAKVVVFNVVEKGDSVANTVARVEIPAGMTSQFSAYKPAMSRPASAELFKIVNGYAYPGTQDVTDKYNVIKFNKYSSEVLIDADKDPVYEVADLGKYEVLGLPYLNSHVETIKLWDGKGYATFELAREAHTFFYNEIVKGARVQVNFDKDNNKVINIVSVREDKPGLKGELPYGVPAGRIVEAKFIDTSDVGEYVVATLSTKLPNGNYSQYPTYVAVPENDLKDVVKGDVITLDRVVGINSLVRDKDGKLLEVYKLVKNHTKDAAADLTAAETKLNATIELPKGTVVANDEATKALIKTAVETKLADKSITVEVGTVTVNTAPTNSTVSITLKKAPAADKVVNPVTVTVAVQ